MKLRVNSTKIFLSIALGLFLASCGSEQQALTQSELSEKLISEGTNESIVDCVSGLYLSEYPDSERTESLINDLSEACQDASDELAILDSKPSEETDKLAFAEPIDYGDDEDLDILWDQCEAGTGKSCDELFMNSPISSEYEKFGLSCGRRPEVLYCDELGSDGKVEPTPEAAVVDPAEDDSETTDEDTE